MRKIMEKLLFELLRDSKRSDRELAKVLEVSQATVSRMRNKLVRDGVIREFTIIPDFVKMGYTIMAISSFKNKTAVTPELREKGEKWMNKYPNVIFASRVQGMGKNAVIISLHKNYTDYSNFVANLRVEWGDYIEGHDSMLIALKGPIVKPLSLKYLAEEKSSGD